MIAYDEIGLSIFRNFLTVIFVATRKHIIWISIIGRRDRDRNCKKKNVGIACWYSMYKLYTLLTIVIWFHTVVHTLKYVLNKKYSSHTCMHTRVQWFFKLTMLHVVLDWQEISKTILEQAFFFIFWRFYLFSVFVLINFEIGPSERWKFFFLK